MIDEEDPVAGTVDADRLLRLLRLRSEFAVNLSRDLRTPLTLLLGPLQDILGSPASDLAPASRSLLEEARRNAEKVLQLLDSLPTFRVAADTARLEPASPDLAAFTTELAEYFRPSCAAAGLHLVVDCPPLGRRIAADRAVWEKIVINLVANAFKSTREGTIEVRLSVEDEHARLIVSDTGEGIPEAELPYVFHRLDRVMPERVERSGIGLPFVHDLVLLHGGTIDVHSAQGRGTTFTVRLPLLPVDATAPVVDGSASAASPAVTTHPRVAETVARGRGHIVVAEDHPETRDYLCDILTASGFTVDAVGDGLGALERCTSAAPDALVSDVLMPGLGGFELIARLRADARTAVIPVLLLSARSGEESRIEGIAAGADDYLVKPLSRRELVARVDGAVRLGRLRREIARREDQRFRDLSGRLVEVQEAERRQLSTELHDQTSPQLAAIQINLKMLGTLLRDRETEDVAALLDDTAHLVAETTQTIREISSDLRPAVLDDGGLPAALAAHAQQFTQRTGIFVHLDTAHATGTPPSAVQSSLFRIAQEALTNCAKHAKARNVRIRLSTDGASAMSLEVEDDGVGFDAEALSTTGLGLLTMRERVEFLGGRFTLDSRRGRGTRILVVV